MLFDRASALWREQLELIVTDFAKGAEYNRYCQ